MAGAIPAEGVSSGVAPVKLEEVDPPDMSSTQWKEAGVINQLFIYPVKSMRGISVPSAKVCWYLNQDHSHDFLNLTVCN